MLAYIALQRAGKGDLPIDLLWDLEAGKITLDFSDEEQEADASPPESAPRRRGRAERKERFFLARFERRWGSAPGTHPPELYWAPWLGDWCHLGPDDLADLTPEQLDSCVD